MNILKNSSQFFFIIYLCFVSVYAMASGKDNRPNILFIYTDDQSHRTISSYSDAYDWVSTPNIDQLAKEGILFTHAYIGTWCMPSRATMLTGRHQYGIESMRMEGAYPNSTYDPEKAPFLPKVMREKGYYTAHIGKWHTGTDTGYGRDWDHQVVWNRPRYPENSKNYYYDQVIEVNGGKPKVVKGYSTDNYTKWAKEFINGKNRDANKPWYLWLAYGGTHAGYKPAKRHLEAYNGVTVPVPADIYGPRHGKPAYMQKVRYWEKGPDGKPVSADASIPFSSDHTKSHAGDSTSHDSGSILGDKDLSIPASAISTGIHGNTLDDQVRQYHQTALSLDDAVGELLKVLEETGQRENTLIIGSSGKFVGKNIMDSLQRR